MEMVLGFALITLLAGNLLMLWRAWPSLARALAGPDVLPPMPCRQPAEVIPIGGRRRDARLPVLYGRSALRLAA